MSNYNAMEQDFWQFLLVISPSALSGLIFFDACQRCTTMAPKADHFGAGGMGIPVQHWQNRLGCGRLNVAQLLQQLFMYTLICFRNGS
jgi:hypothetical protein